MTEISSLRAQNGIQVDTSAALGHGASTHINGFSPVPDIGDEEEYSTIRCICGFDDDDGNTVFCEECKTWQHIVCYYPGKPVLDEKDVHLCVLCKPRPVDANGATQQQQTRLGLVPSGERKVKRAPKTAQKKRAKDGSTTNGLKSSHAAHAQDRGSGSPRDQQPPAKRPKTSHKSSSSTSVPHTSVSQRKRTGSTVMGRSPMKRQQSPPVYRGDYYSPSFMRLYRDNKFKVVRDNSYSSISIPNDLTNWLSDPESRLPHTSRTSQEIFQRWDKPFEELEQTSPGVTERLDEDTSISIHGQHPIHARLIANAPVAPNHYIGELNGEIARKEDYVNKARWAELHHPEPFVFFHDHLPIIIDSRREGSIFRYIRRSCAPNVKLQTIVLGTEYHFCLVSQREILENEEITLGWNLPEEAHRIMESLLREGIDLADEDYMINWTCSVLSNFGGCACGRPLGSCPLSRFDRRIHPNTPLSTEVKSTKNKKPKKNGIHISPTSTGRATNSRAVSEAVNGELDDDNADTRSISASSRSKPTSRDITPTVGLGVQLTDREKRKLKQEEKLFEQLELQEQQGGKKKKRNSAGSALSTPALNSSKQLGFPDTANPSPTAAYSTTRQRINGSMPTIQSGKSTNGTSTPVLRQKPVYANSSTQTDEDSALKHPAPNVSLLRQCRGSHIQRLLKASKADKERRARQVAERRASCHAQTSQPASPAEHISMRNASTSMPPPPLPTPLQIRRSASPSRPPLVTKQEDNEDIEMKDIEDVQVNEKPSSPVASVSLTAAARAESSDPAAVVQDTSDTQANTVAKQESVSPTEGIVPILPSSDSAVQPAITPTPTPSTKGPALHVKLPPVPSFVAQQSSTQTPTTPSVADILTPGSAPPESPVGMNSPSPSLLQHPPLFSPGLMGSAVAPSPQKKKMTLSDYTKRRKKQAQVGGPAPASGLFIPSDSTLSNDMISSPVMSDDKVRLSGVSPDPMSSLQQTDSAGAEEDTIEALRQPSAGQVEPALQASAESATLEAGPTTLAEEGVKQTDVSAGTAAPSEASNATASVSIAPTAPMGFTLPPATTAPMTATSTATS